MLAVRPRRALHLVGGIEHLILVIRDRHPGHVKACDDHGRHRSFVRLRVRAIAAHRETPARDEEHFHADRAGEVREFLTLSGESCRGNIDFNLRFLFCHRDGRAIRPRSRRFRHGRSPHRHRRRRVGLLPAVRHRCGLRRRHHRRAGHHFEILVYEILRLTAREPQAFTEIAHRIALVVAHLVAIQAEARHFQDAAEFILRAARCGGCRKRRHGDRNGSRSGFRRRCLHDTGRTLALQCCRDHRVNVCLRNSKPLSRDGELFLALLAEPLVGKREIQKLPEFVERVPEQLAVQFRINARALLGIEQLRAGLGEKMRRFIEPPAQHLCERVARLIFQRQLFLPPHENPAAVILDDLRGRIRGRIKAQARVEIGRIVILPIGPSARIVGNWIGKCHDCLLRQGLVPRAK